jgi:hypothetical protein
MSQSLNLSFWVTSVWSWLGMVAGGRFTELTAECGIWPERLVQSHGQWQREERKWTGPSVRKQLCRWEGGQGGLSDQVNSEPKPGWWDYTKYVAGSSFWKEGRHKSAYLGKHFGILVCSRLGGRTGEEGLGDGAGPVATLRSRGLIWKQWEGQ